MAWAQWEITEAAKIGLILTKYALTDADEEV